MRHGLARYVRSRLHRRLFVWFGLSILGTALAVGLALLVLQPGDHRWARNLERLRTFAANQLADAWDEPARRDALALAVHRDLGVAIRLEDSSGAVIATQGEGCRRPDLVLPIVREGRPVGTAKLCAPRQERRAGLTFFVVLGVALLSIWGASGMVARRLVAPLREVASVADELGRGNLGARVTLDRNQVGEIGILADAINEMSDRIERQMADQRELLAGVSHEIRSPLARMQVLVELARERGGDAGALAEIEREIAEVDSLVGELLASSRLDFQALERRPLDGVELGRRALERAGLGPELLDARAERAPCEGDPTLLGRALANLLENARRHGRGVASLRVEVRGEQLVFAVEDEGPGFAPQDLSRVFESFVRGERSAGSSLGLGLSLVRRIAEAHGGRAWAENRADRGARVSFSVRAARP